MIITLDGPAASGKSTIARMLAQDLDCYYIYSGLLYRAFAYVALVRCISFDHMSTQQIAELIKQLQYQFCDGKEQIFFDTEDITDALFTPQIDDAASRVSVNSEVRNAINLWQKELAYGHDVIIDGRDSGSVVFAQADLKFYLEVPLEIRAERWALKQKHAGRYFSLPEALEVLQKRDMRDKQRAVAPLMVPEGAVVLENTGHAKTIVAKIKEHLQKKI